MTVVITTCTNRKRQPIPDELRISAHGPTNMADLAAQWTARLDATTARHRAVDLYGGRGFKEARSAAERLNARLLIASGGLGLIEGSASIPPYACTIIPGTPDSVGSRIEGTFSVSGWWSALAMQSGWRVALDDVVRGETGLILAALSDGYIEMIAGDLLALSVSVRSRLRLFTRAPIERVPVHLAPFVMPYDVRLDGPDSPIRGTISDFAGRALHHFAERILVREERCSAAAHQAQVAEALSDWRVPEKINRARLDDAGILALLRTHQGDPAGMSLARLRGEFKIACEQRRYSKVTHTVRSEKK